MLLVFLYFRVKHAVTLLAPLLFLIVVLNRVTKRERKHKENNAMETFREIQSSKYEGAVTVCTHSSKPASAYVILVVLCKQLAKVLLTLLKTLRSQP